MTRYPAASTGWELSPLAESRLYGACLGETHPFQFAQEKRRKNVDVHGTF
jgi:hypothetical protein